MQVLAKRALYKALSSPFPHPQQIIISPSKCLQQQCSAGLYGGQYFLGSGMHQFLCTEVEKPQDSPTEAVKELYQKIVKSLESKTFPPNTWRDALLGKCKNAEDVKLAFEILEKLRIFKMACLWQPGNWPQQITSAVASASVRGNAPDIGLRTLWRHNYYGLTPSIAAAHSLLLYAKEKKNITLMRKILQTMEKNLLKPQPKTADIVLSICYDNQQWKLISIYAKQFLKDGLKLHRDAYDIWISTAAKLGNTLEVWKIQELRSLSGYKHTIPSAFSCAKAHLLKWQPKEAAEVIFQLSQDNQSELKKKDVSKELDLLVDKWPATVIFLRRRDRRKAISTELKQCISLMFNCLSNMGFNVPFNAEERYCSKSKKAIATLQS